MTTTVPTKGHIDRTPDQHRILYDGDTPAREGLDGLDATLGDPVGWGASCCSWGGDGAGDIGVLGLLVWFVVLETRDITTGVLRNI